MKSIFTYIIILILIGGLMTNCKSDPSDNAHAEIMGNVKPVKIERFDRAVAEYGEMNTLAKDSVLNFYSPLISLMGDIENIDDGDSLLCMLSSSAATSVFQPDIERRMPDLSEIESGLGLLKEGLRQTMPDVSFPKHVYGAVIPYGQSVVVADSFVVIGLNHYLGSDYEGYNGFDEYRRRLKIPERIVLDIAEALVYTAFPYEDRPESTVMSRLIYEGLVVRCVKDALPETEIERVLGYDLSQMAWLRENESRIWQKLASDNMLFSADPALASRLVSPAPSTPAINPLAPGRAGRYIGSRIVDSYLSSHEDVSAATLLEKKFYNDPAALVGAGYSGK